MTAVDVFTAELMARDAVCFRFMVDDGNGVFVLARTPAATEVLLNIDSSWDQCFLRRDALYSEGVSGELESECTDSSLDDDESVLTLT